MELPVFLLALGASLRLTRLITKDFVFGPIRLWFINFFGPSESLIYFVSCPWCIGMYVSAVVVGAGALVGSSLWFVVPAAVLTVSWLVGVCTAWLDPDK